MKKATVNEREAKIRKAVRNCPDKHSDGVLEYCLEKEIGKFTSQEMEYAKALCTVPTSVL